MDIFVGELFGTLILVLLGDGVVAGVLLKNSKAENSGWIVITAGWGFAVAMGVYVAGWSSGAHMNPAVTIGLLSIGKVTINQTFLYVAGQMLGAFLGAVLVWLHYLPHWKETDDQDLKRAVFCTAPAIRSPKSNLVSEIIGTAVLLIGVLAITAKYQGYSISPTISISLNHELHPLLIGILVWSIGLSLGGTTGYAINPARDLAPRIAHAILPIPDKGSSDWGYAWVPVVGPIIGGILGCLIYNLYSSQIVP